MLEFGMCMLYGGDCIEGTVPRTVSFLIKLKTQTKVCGYLFFLSRFEQDAKGQNYIVVSFWMAGDHYMVAWGSVNESQPMLFFVDTGLAGGGFTCPESTLKEGGIKLQENLASEGVGGGGKVKVIPFVVEELTFGEAKGQNIQGLFTGAFPLENAFGFRIGGLISHGFFRPYALTLDFTGMRLFLK
jgi:hypothetical protein